jgi:hypothetical protein
MMIRVRSMAIGVALIVALAGPAWAGPIEEQVTATLETQGYDIVSVGRTWLGRLRIVAESDELRREIVLNPTTGEVLRDYSVRLIAGTPGLGFEDDSDTSGDNVAAAARTGTDGLAASDPVTSALEVMTDSVAPPVDGAGQ